MLTTTLGRNGPVTSRMGLGCMGMSDFYGPADEASSLRTIARAAELKITLLDTGDFYGMGHNEMLVGRALKEIGREKFVLSVKFGALRTPAGLFAGMDARPTAIRNFLAYSLKRLGTDHIDIYRPARLDPAVPIEDTIGAIGEMIKAGYVRHAGLSEVSSQTIRRANAICPICDVQLEYSLMSRGIEKSILPTLRELGIGVTAYGVLSRGLIADKPLAGMAGIRGLLPRFQGENYVANRALVHRLAAMAHGKGVTTSQLAIAWVSSRGDDIVPLIGTCSPQRLEEAVKALDLGLTDSDFAEMEKAIPAQSVQGTRYDAHQMAALDSEGSDRPHR